jgi:acyl-CoA thioesterase
VSDNEFDTGTAVEALGDGRFAAHIDRGWWVVVGPNGGYLAAILLRALSAAVDDPARAPRSLSVHYLRPPAEGPAAIETQLERVGRSLTSVSARLHQHGHLVALALAAFSPPWSGRRAYEDARMPEAAPPERCEPMAHRIPIHERYEQRWAIGAPPFSGAAHALCGGWIRPAQPRAVDALLIAAYADAFPPALFSRLSDWSETAGVPTVDLTIHFRDTLPRAGAALDDWTLGVFRSSVAREGFLEEDGELWSRDGVLLAQSRQLALAR